MKLREMTPEELKAIRVQHYDTGFTMWMKQPGLKGERWILDASTFLETGHIHISEPKNKWKYGTMLSGSTIQFIATE